MLDAIGLDTVVVVLRLTGLEVETRLTFAVVVVVLVVVTGVLTAAVVVAVAFTAGSGCTTTTVGLAG